jgi:hypothetical protein
MGPRATASSASSRVFWGDAAGSKGNARVPHLLHDVQHQQQRLVARFWQSVAQGACGAGVVCRYEGPYGR